MRTSLSDWDDRVLSTFRFLLTTLSLLSFVIVAPALRAGETISPDHLDFFEKKIRPVLVEHCYSCHSAESKELKGGLRLDLKEGWITGGESGSPAIIPGKPNESSFILSVRHEGDSSAMPPDRPKLAENIVADLVKWVTIGAPDPRDGKLEKIAPSSDWETLYRGRLTWWSLQPVTQHQPPTVAGSNWARNDVDRFIESALVAKGLHPAPEAEPRVLARRLHFALTGLPPTPETVERFVTDTSPGAYEAYVQSLLNNPHFGEHWARHWLDVVHYTDTHGYEWDVPVKNAWMYRDYVTRSFNNDLPIDRFLLEQMAGDLIDPRVDPKTGINESLVATMALRLGERRHGDNAAAEGVTQEAMANVIDTVSKGFLGTTVACAQCHDHKLDAVAQSDYYALSGMFMSTRWGVESVDAIDPNDSTLEEMKHVKEDIRKELSKLWLASAESMKQKLQALPAEESKTDAFPETLTTFWQRSLKSPPTPVEFAKEQERRVKENKANLKLVADFTCDDGALGWRTNGFGMKHGLVHDGEIVVAEEGDFAVTQILPAGRWSYAWSSRLAGSLRSPLLDVTKPFTYSLGLAGGKQAAWSFIVDQAFHSERLQFLNQPLRWLTVTAGNFDTLEGSIDKQPRRVYFEVVTKSLNNYFPPRTAYNGLKEEDVVDPRSWFGVTRIYEHPSGKPPLDELSRFEPLLTDSSEWPDRFVHLVMSAIERWSRGECTNDDARIMDEALQGKLLTNESNASPELKALIANYRELEKKLQGDQTIGVMTDWTEGRDERIGVRGSYTEFGDTVPRGNIRFLGGAAERSISASSGRLEFARDVVRPTNPLTARVFVNRVWLHLFGEGLVRTPDDFGHLGEKPSHPELLDFLALRFVNEGWSLKQLITYLVCSATWRQTNVADVNAIRVDPENRLWHYRPMRRLEAESIRDSILAISGRLDESLYGAPRDPYRTAEDASKRLFSGPVDGDGRRSIYTKMTLMEPPRFLAIFNQPIPKLTTGRRDVTNVPDQALALLNDPFVVAMAHHWSEQLQRDNASSPDERVAVMFVRAFARPPKPDETARLIRLAEQSADLRGEKRDSLLQCSAAWQDLAHAIFNMKEFVYVP